MLLIFGSDNDPNARRIADQAHIHAVAYRQLDPAQLETFSLQWTFLGADLFIDGEPITPQALYLRHDVFTPEHADRSYQIYSSLQGYALAHPELRLLNRQTAGSSNNKCFNLARAKALGLRIPESTIVTSDQAIGQVLEPSDQERVAKPLEGGDHTVPVSALDEPFAKYQSVFVQERLRGRNIRLFVIGGVPHAFELKTTDLDYRTDPEVQVFSTRLDQRITELGVALAQQLNFDYCALDFREDETGHAVFLEINSFPMFTAFDNACGNALADAQLRFLCDGWFDYPA